MTFAWQIQHCLTQMGMLRNWLKQVGQSVAIRQYRIVFVSTYSRGIKLLNSCPAMDCADSATALWSTKALVIDYGIQCDSETVIEMRGTQSESKDPFPLCVDEQHITLFSLGSLCHCPALFFMDFF